MSEKMEAVKEKGTSKTPEQIREIFDKWFAQSICDSPISRNTEIYNYFFSIKESLLKELTK